MGLRVIKDDPSGPRGPVAALYSAWKTMPNTDEGFFTAPVDGPNVPGDICERLYGERSAIAKAPDGLHQAFAWWRLEDLKSAFAQVDLKKPLSLIQVAKLCHVRHIFWSHESLFYNINTPNDLSAYLTKNAH